MYPFEQAIRYLAKTNFSKLTKSIKAPKLSFSAKFKDTFELLSRVIVIKNYKKAKSKKRKKKSKKKKGVHQLSFKVKLAIAFMFGILFTFLFIITPLYAYDWYKKLPQPELLDQTVQNRATKITDRKGRLLYEIYVDKKYDPVELKTVPDHVINATLAIEDDKFYSHYGFDIISIIRAARSTVFKNELQGGSTITQQLVKNVLLTPERTISRKIKELVLSVLVENKYSKNEILELYLNNIPYGGTAYGIQSASQKYFNKDVSNLDLAEASMLAGLPSAPTAYSPVQGNETLAKVRQKVVLDRMVELGFITEIEASAAYEKDLVFAPQIEYIRAPHFVEFVRKSLYEKYGQRAVDFGGLTVTTSLDLELQEQVQQIVFNEIAQSSRLNISNGAAVVIDSRSGGILAYVGSVDYFSEDDGKFDVVTAYRQPGSSIKPVTYALAFEKGFTPATIVDDSPITYQSYGQVYSPKNYDNKFRGKVTLRQALANSYNIPAVKLVNRIGMDDMVQFGNTLGLKNWIPKDGSYGLSVTLGGKEVRLLDLTNIYATFSRGGLYKDVTPFINIRDAYGFEIYNLRNNPEKRVLKETTAYIISNILFDNASRSPTFGTFSKLVVPEHTVAVKTGTTNDIRDNLTLGYTPSYTVGVWVGNNDNTPMSQVASGVSGAAPIWNNIMQVILTGTPDEPFVVPEGIIIKTDKSCGITEVFDKDSKIPSKLCVEKKDKDANKKNEEE